VQIKKNLITFKNKEIHTNGVMPKEGKAQDFVLVDRDLKEKSLKDFPGIKILSINPSFDTSVCASTAKYFNDFAKKHTNIKILLISKDLPFAQKRFCEHLKLNNVYFLSMMLSDQFAKDYGVLMVDGPLKGLTARAVFLLNEKNEIIYSELVSEVTNEPNYENLEKSLTK